MSGPSVLFPKCFLRLVQKWSKWFPNRKCFRTAGCWVNFLGQADRFGRWQGRRADHLTDLHLDLLKIYFRLRWERFQNFPNLCFLRCQKEPLWNIRQKVSLQSPPGEGKDFNVLWLYKRRKGSLNEENCILFCHHFDTCPDHTCKGWRWLCWWEVWRKNLAADSSCQRATRTNCFRFCCLNVALWLLVEHNEYSHIEKQFCPAENLGPSVEAFWSIPDFRLAAESRFIAFFASFCLEPSKGMQRWRGKCIPSTCYFLVCFKRLSPTPTLGRNCIFTKAEALTSRWSCLFGSEVSIWLPASEHKCF